MVNPYYSAGPVQNFKTELKRWVFFFIMISFIRWNYTIFGIFMNEIPFQMFR